MTWTRIAPIAATLVLGASAACVTSVHADQARPASTPDTTVSAGYAGTASAEFCEAFVALELSFGRMPDDPAFTEEFLATEVAPLLPVIQDNAPTDIATEVGIRVAAEELAMTGDESLFDAPEYAAASAVIYPALEAACGLPTVSVSAVDYTFEGVSETLAGGPTLFVMQNTSAAGEFHVMVIIQLNDGDDVTLDEMLSMPEDEALLHVAAEYVVAADAASSGGAIVDLAPGRWIYLCPIPVGTAHGEQGSGPPHFVEGMSGEFVVG